MVILSLSFRLCQSNMNCTQTKRFERNVSYALNLYAILQRYLRCTLGVCTVHMHKPLVLYVCIFSGTIFRFAYKRMGELVFAYMEYIFEIQCLGICNLSLWVDIGLADTVLSNIQTIFNVLRETCE